MVIAVMVEADPRASSGERFDLVLPGRHETKEAFDNAEGMLDAAADLRLDKALSGDGNPGFATVMKVAHALGLQTCFRRTA
ncbi:MAG: hypothetical protein ACYCVM_07930 [Acidiferrobacter sp.]